MKRFSLGMTFSVSVLLAGLLAAVPALAAPPGGGPHRGSGYHHQTDNPGYYGKGHQQRPGHNYKGQKRGVYRGQHHYFTDHHRVVVHDYYAGQYRKGHCPPGLARKGYGCVPRKPARARAWVVGRPLPRTVIYHDLPPQVLVQLGPAPSHHRFVRVAQDILLIATGTGMVVDAIDNLSWEFNR
ncbi:MAG: hypothetical protein GXY54_11230 [Deltaproteobacteria bacterium]|nr:hypothetical protein [Deltaproteobacteria bacterium]